MWTSALGTSRRYDSGSEESNDDSYLPQITSRRGCFSCIQALPPGIVFDVGAVVVEQVALNLDLAGLIEKSKFIRPQIGVIAFHVGIASDMARPRRLQRQQVGTKRAFVGRAIGPKSPPRLPVRPETFIVCHSVLHDQSLDPLRVRQGHAKTHG